MLIQEASFYYSPNRDNFQYQIIDYGMCMGSYFIWNRAYLKVSSWNETFMKAKWPSDSSKSKEQPISSL
jgi:hypothetical protein